MNFGKKYNVVDDIYPDPQLIKNFINDLPMFGDQQAGKPPGGWKGRRSQQIDFDDGNVFDMFMAPIVNTFTFLPDGRPMAYMVEAYIHDFPQELDASNWWHYDNAMLAGVVYLNEDPDPQGGTTLILDEVETPIENKYNRMVVYDATTKHCVTKTFAGRQTFNFFILGMSI